MNVEDVIIEDLNKNKELKFDSPYNNWWKKSLLFPYSRPLPRPLRCLILWFIDFSLWGVRCFLSKNNFEIIFLSVVDPLQSWLIWFSHRFDRCCLKVSLCWKYFMDLKAFRLSFHVVSGAVLLFQRLNEAWLSRTFKSVSKIF